MTQTARISSMLLLTAVIMCGCGKGGPGDEAAKTATKGPGAPDTIPKSAATLVSQTGCIAPGGETLVGVYIELAPGWHTYSDPPGDSGMAPIIKWSLPHGVTAGEIQYPAHVVMEDAAGTTHGFAEGVLLVIPLIASGELEAGTEVNLSAQVDYLICNAVCIPQRGELEGTLKVSVDPCEETSAWRDARAAGGWMEKDET